MSRVADAPVVEIAVEGDRLIAIGEVGRTVGLGSTTIYKLMNAGAFPRPASIVDVAPPETIKSGQLRWSAREIQAWIAARLAARRTTPVDPED